MTNKSDGAGQDGYDPAAIKVLHGLTSRRRPWQLLLTGDGLATADAAMVDGLARILELMPSVPSLAVQTAQGTLMATRDFPSDLINEVDVILAGLFRSNSDLAGIRFPETETRPAHTATLGDPFWSADGMATASVMAALSRGEITPQEAGDQLGQIYQQPDQADP